MSAICEYLEPLYPVYLDDQATPDERSLIEGHLARCPFCRAVVSWTRRALQCETGLVIGPPAGFHERLMARLHDETSSSD